MIKIYSTMDGWVSEMNHAYYRLPATWELDALFTASNPHEFLQLALKDKKAGPLTAPSTRLLAPLQSQEVWAAGGNLLSQSDCTHGGVKGIRGRQFL